MFAEFGAREWGRERELTVRSLLSARSMLLSATILIGVILTIVVSVVATTDYKVGLGIAAVALCAALGLRARQPVLPWLSLVPIVLAGLTVPKLGAPLADVGAAIALALVLRTPNVLGLTGRPPRYIYAALTALVLTAAATLPLDHPPTGGAIKRVVHIVLFSLLLLAIARGRIEARNLSFAIRVGLTIGLLTGVASFLGFSDHGYVHRLTGWFEDPNVAAYEAVALGCIALYHSRSRQETRLVIALMTAITVLSLSRTGLLALCFTFFWLYAGHRMPKVVAAATVAVLTVVALRLPAAVQTFGPFAAHAASDNLRHLIDLTAVSDVTHHWLTGTGAGTAHLVISNGEQFFFHNSFYAMVAEFGAMLTAVYFVLMLSTIVYLARTPRRSREIEAAIITMFVVSLSLGEVLLALTGAVVIGSAWFHILRERERSRRSYVLEPAAGRQPVLI